MKKLLLLTTVTAVMNLALISSAGAQTFGGHATGAQVTVPATGTTLRAATGSLSSSGGTVDASLLIGSIPSSLTGGGGPLPLRPGARPAWRGGGPARTLNT